MPKRNAEQKAAWALKEAEGIDYQEALRRVRAEAAAEPATADAPASDPAAVVYVLQPTPAEAELDITAEELGVRALPETATPEQRAHAEAMWRPEPDPARRCRCSGTDCRQGAPCPFADEGCEGRRIHLDRHPGSLWGITTWWDTYECTGCGEQFEGDVELPELPWGEKRPNDGGGFTTVVYDGVRHPNFPGIDTDEDEDELDPDTYPTPEDDYYAYDDQEDEEPPAEEDQEDGPDYLDDAPEDDVDPIGEPSEDYDGGPDEDELGPPSRVPAVDLDPQSTAADWSTQEARSW
ncbi:hypothetical protein OG762_51475 (plasmid) [Streptomyces sp. NBC_01136]|uniref:hypothetical protein n=1 Tax=Streptomyces sp. NBC_01136 TaxID=2903754 RepID=UPI002F91A139|nr:hypothetical protein OG762_51475 [Streptomyces sp. NBC_01136]